MEEPTDSGAMPGGLEGLGREVAASVRVEPVVSVAQALGAVRDAVSQVGRCFQGASDRDLVEALTVLEEAKNSCCAIQARATVALREGRERVAATAREREDAARSVISEVALARRESPHRARTLVGLATALTRELPHTLEALAGGRISEWRAILVARETACLSVEDRARVDREIAPGLAAWSNRTVAAGARRVAYRLDPHSVAAHTARAASERRVTIRPAPDCMSVVSAVLPVAQGVAVHAALVRAAESARAAGEARGRGQVMADTLVERVTGQASAEAVPVEVHLVVSDETLLAGGPAPAHLAGFGPVPAGVARALATAEEDTQAWVRRLYVRPGDGGLVAMESTRRFFPEGLRRFIRTRDADICRTPWCGAPIAHIDHVIPAEAGGATTASNAQGLCAHCNQAKQAPGWRTTAHPDGSITLTTPTAHAYTTRPPPLPHQDTPPDADAVTTRTPSTPDARTRPTPENHAHSPDPPATAA